MQMKKMAMIALTMAAPAVAGNWWNDCCPDLCYNFSVGAEALYWRPCTYQLEAATLRSGSDSTFSGEAVTATNHKPFVNRPDGIWGFRIFGTVADECNCNFANLEWAYLKGTSTRKFNTGDSTIILQPSNNAALAHSEVFARQRTRYNKVSLKLGHRFCGNDCSFLYGYVGGRWAEARVKWKSTGTESTNVRPVEFKFNTEFNGGGFEVGLGFYQDVWCGFGINGRVGLLGLWGDRQYSVKQFRGIGTATSGQGTLDFANFDKSDCVGGYEMRLGLNYVYECGCWWVRGEIGYEHNHYFNAIWAPASTVANWNSSATTDFAIGGLYFGLTFGF